jgi:hypothetical protein
MKPIRIAAKEGRAVLAEKLPFSIQKYANPKGIDHVVAA